MDTLENAIAFCMKAHREHPIAPRKATRKWDGETPYSIHPIWCATTLLTETTLPREFRRDGAIALLYHDILEDTTVTLPLGTSLTIREMVEDMTYESFDTEMELVWEKPPHIFLLKLYDKVSNLLDGVWMDDAKTAIYRRYTGKLLQCTEAYYAGQRLNIVSIAKSILQ